jgi:hypothetical protein
MPWTNPGFTADVSSPLGSVGGGGVAKVTLLIGYVSLIQIPLRVLLITGFWPCETSSLVDSELNGEIVSATS